MIKVYIAASFSGHQRIRTHAHQLESRGFKVLSHWFKEEHFIEKSWDNNFGGDVAEIMATVDNFQIINADLVILDTIEKSSTGGSDTELGLALSAELFRGRPHIVHIGPYRNIFQKLVTDHYNDWDEYFDFLDRRVQ